LILSAIAAVLVVSCSKQTIETPPATDGEGEIIRFTTPGVLSRGSEITDKAGVATAGGFAVWALNHSGLWASGSAKTPIIDTTGDGYGVVTSSDGGTTWSYGTPAEWPLGRVSFFAYAPYTTFAGSLTGSLTVISPDAEGVPQIRYRVPREAVEQVDLMIADPVYNRLGRDPVTESFHHALSRVRFTAAKTSDLASDVVKVLLVRIDDISCEGTASLKTPVVWTPIATSQNFPLATVDNGSLQDLALTTSQQNLHTTTGTMFVLPQTLGSGTANLTVTYQINGLQLSWAGKLPTTAWEPGKAYLYQLLIGTDMVMVISGNIESPGDGTWGDYDGEQYNP
jgi:hypothetical protein